MTASDRFIEFTDDRSDDATRRIREARSVGLIARAGEHPIWLGDRGGPPGDWHPRLMGNGTGASPTVVSFYTPYTAYEDLAELLRASCERYGVAHRIAPRAARGSWERNCAIKAEFVQSMRDRIEGPLVWVDADASLASSLDDLAELDADFGIHLLDGWRALSGTIYFGDSHEARQLIDRWCDRCRAEPDIWDQIHLDLAWEDVARTADLRTAWLDERFVKIFDREPDPGRPPVIVHSQASREHKHEVSGGIRGGEQEPVAEVRDARALSRWREGAPRPSRESVVIGAADESVKRWHEQRERTVEAALRSCVDRGLGRVALVGAGRHTVEVALPVAKRAGVTVRCILDDRAEQIGPVESVPVCRIEACPAEIDALVISSDAHESALAERCRDALGIELPVIEPYREAAERSALSGTGSR